jgi:hypothetical protein
MKEIECPKCKSTKCKYVKNRPEYDCKEYICESCNTEILVPGSTWD